MVTAILAAFNERNNPLFWENVRQLRPHTQLIVVDGGSQDGTIEQLFSYGADIYLIAGSNRAQRYNLGIQQALGDVILLVHPRTLVPPSAIPLLESLAGTTAWGAFTHRFDQEHPILSFTSWYSNRVRGDGRGIYYLDHCLFLTKDLRGSARFPEVELFEDTYFCRTLRKICKPVRLPVEGITSAIRFQKNGIWRQAALNQLLKLMFHMGVSEEWMGRMYEKGLSLNIARD